MPRPIEVVGRWIAAINDRDVEAVAACFAEDYEDEAPARRGEVVRGRDEVRRNFDRLFESMSDLRASPVNLMEDGERVWLEWAMTGTRGDGTVMEFVGVNLFDVRDGVITRGRIYTELVRDAGGTTAQVRRMTSG